MEDNIPNNLEEKIEYYKRQNEFLKKKLRQLTAKYNIMEEEFDRLLEEIIILEWFVTTGRYYEIVNRHSIYCRFI